MRCRVEIHSIAAAETRKREQLEVQWRSEKQAMEQIQGDLAHQISKQASDHQQAIQSMMEEQRAEHEQAQRDLLDAHAKALENQHRQLEELKAAEFEEFAQKCIGQQQEAITRREQELHQQHTNRVAEIQAIQAERLAHVVDELTVVKVQSAEFEQRLQARAKALQEAEHTVVQLERELSGTRKGDAIALWRLLVSGSTTTKMFRQKLVAAQKEGQAALEELQQDCTDRLNAATRSVERLTQLLQQSANLQTQVKDVLVTHKADMLTERKKQIQVCVYCVRVRGVDVLRIAGHTGTGRRSTTNHRRARRAA